MSYVEVYNVFSISSLDADCKWLKGVKSECHKSPSRRRWTLATDNASVNLEFKQARVACVKPEKTKQMHLQEVSENICIIHVKIIFPSLCEYIRMRVHKETLYGVYRLVYALPVYEPFCLTRSGHMSPYAINLTDQIG